MIANQKLIILDRDGVINMDSKAYIKSPEEWIPIAKSLEAIQLLTQLGFTIAIVTNQSGVGRGYYDLATLAAIHEKMLKAIRKVGGEIAAIFFCPHTPEAGCDCRKPKTGLFKRLQNYFQCDLKNIWAVGDSKRDIEAAVSVGCQPVLVKTGNGAQLLATQSLEKNCLVFDDLWAVATALDK